MKRIQLSSIILVLGALLGSTVISKSLCGDEIPQPSGNKPQDIITRAILQRGQGDVVVFLTRDMKLGIECSWL